MIFGCTAREWHPNRNWHECTTLTTHSHGLWRNLNEVDSSQKKKHLVPRLSYTAVTQDTHMLGACHASFKHININALVSTISTSLLYDLTCFIVLLYIKEDTLRAHRRSHERCCESIQKLSCVCSFKSVPKFMQATLQTCIVIWVCLKIVYP